MKYIYTLVRDIGFLETLCQFLVRGKGYLDKLSLKFMR